MKTLRVMLAATYLLALVAASQGLAYLLCLALGIPFLP